MSNLERAIEIAVTAHKGQSRKNGTPYILHPLRVMMRVTSTDEMIVAVLHDVVEDTDVTIEQIVDEGFSADVIEALRLLTHDESQAYDDYIASVNRNDIARTVKLADLRDNSNIFEIPTLERRDVDRIQKYHRAFKTLSEDSSNVDQR